MRLPALAVVMILLVSLGFTQQPGSEPAAERTSPFDAIHIADDGTIKVTVGDAEGLLLSVAGVEVERLVPQAQATYGDRWKKRIAEDLPDVIETITGQRPPALVPVTMRLEGGEVVALQSRFTRERRRAIYDSDYGAGPRGDVPQVIYDPEVARATMRLAASIMEAHWSYRHLRPDVDVEAELLALVEGDGPVTVEQLTDGITRVLAMFPDGHAGATELLNMRGRGDSAPATFAWLGEQRVAVLVPDRSGHARPIDPERPFLDAIDGTPLADWIAAARRLEPTAASGSDWHAVELLRFVPILRRQLGHPASGVVRLTLASADGADKREIELSLSPRPMPARPRDWMTPGNAEPLANVPPDASGDEAADIASAGSKARLAGGVGYIALREMDDSPLTLQGIVDAMNEFRDAPGLVIDVRGNGGGSRLPLLVLWRYLADPGEAPRVVTLAKPLLGRDGRPQAELGGSRFMYPADWTGWSDAERKAVASFADAFEPEWEPGDAFGDWHYLTLGGRLNEMALGGLAGDAYRFDKPVVVLMDGDCFSATSIFLAAMALRDDVTLLGTPAPAGSGRVAIHRIGGETDIHLRLSTMASFQPDGRLFDGNAIAPGIETWPALADFAGRTDSQLEAALRALDDARR